LRRIVSRSDFNRIFGYAVAWPLALAIVSVGGVFAILSYFGL
jgi:hypothetical protein